MLVDQGHVFLFEESVAYEIKTIKGAKIYYLVEKDYF